MGTVGTLECGRSWMNMYKLDKFAVKGVIQAGKIMWEEHGTRRTNWISVEHVGPIKNKVYKLDLVQNGRTRNKLEQFEHGTSLMEEWEAWCTVKQGLASHVEPSTGGGGG